MNKSEKIQAEVDSIIKSAEAMYNFSRMDHATMKAQQELRELGLEQYVPAWVMQKGANADRIVNELIKAVKQDGTKVERGYGFMNADGDGEFVAGRTIPASNLYTLLNEVEEAGELSQDEMTHLSAIALCAGLGRIECYDAETQTKINKMIEMGLVKIIQVMEPGQFSPMVCKDGLMLVKVTKKGLLLAGKHL